MARKLRLEKKLQAEPGQSIALVACSNCGKAGGTMTKRFDGKDRNKDFYIHSGLCPEVK